MSAKVQGWAWDQDVLVQRKASLLWLANRATDNGVCFPGLAEIGARVRGREVQPPANPSS